jgi:hypothetical protein
VSKRAVLTRVKKTSTSNFGASTAIFICCVDTRVIRIVHNIIRIGLTWYRYNHRGRFPLDRLQFTFRLSLCHRIFAYRVSLVSTAAMSEVRRQGPVQYHREMRLRTRPHPRNRESDACDLQGRGNNNDYIPLPSFAFFFVFLSIGSVFSEVLSRDRRTADSSLWNVRSAPFSTPALNIDELSSSSRERAREKARVVTMYKTNISWLCYPYVSILMDYARR